MNAAAFSFQPTVPSSSVRVSVPQRSYSAVSVCSAEPEAGSSKTRRAGAAASVVLAAILSGALSAQAGDLATGEKIFETNCAGCHAGGGQVIPFAKFQGKDLSQKALKKFGYDSVEAIKGLLVSGQAPMPSYVEGPQKLDDAQMEAVSEYVLERAQANWK
eukprot:tig00022075_g23579.t1